MIKFVIFLFICQPTLKCLSQAVKQSLISPYLKTGAYSRNQIDLFSTTGNKAALAQIASVTTGVFSERKFMLNELNLFSAAFALPTQSGNFGLELQHFGNSGYGEMQAGIAYGRKLSDYVDIGAQFNYYTMRISGYGNAAAVNFALGAIFHFTDQLHGGINVYNPTSSKLGKYEEERIPALYSVGLGYDASENFFVSTSIEKEENEDLNVIASLQYKFADRFLARGGIASASSVFFFGVGFSLQSFRVDATASVHPQLGITPGLMLIYVKPAKE